MKYWSQKQSHWLAYSLVVALILAACNTIIDDNNLDPSSLGKIVTVTPGRSIQAAVDAAGPGTTIQLAPGRYREAVTIDKPNIRLVGLGRKHGSQGRAVVILENPGGEDNGITVTPAGSGVEIRNLTIHGFGENGILLDTVDGFLLSEVIAHNNGEYGFYPIRSTNGIIEHCEASGHSDAGVYVGRRSTHIVIRNCKTYGNVTGVELTNSSYLQAYDNEAYGNTAGFLVALLPAFPGAPPVSVSNIELFRNHVYNNNLPNFADHGLEQFMPSGTGMLIIGVDEAVIENNIVTGNHFVGIAVGNTGLLAALAGEEVGNIEPFPDHVKVLDNQVTANGDTTLSVGGLVIPGVDLLWDGTGEDNCWSGNTFDSSLDLNLFGGSILFELPECN